MSDDDKKPDAGKQEPMTLEKLQEMIDDGKVTLAQAANYLAEQQSATAVEKALAKFNDITKDKEVRGAHKAVITRYQKAIPALMDKESDDFKRVAKVFERLKEEGYPDNEGTERMALLETYGKISSVERAKEPKPETFKDGGSGSDDGDEGKKEDDPNAPPASFSQREKEFYGTQINLGTIKDWEAAADIVRRRGNPTLRAAMKDQPLRRARA